MSDLRRVYGKLTYEVRLQELEPERGGASWTASAIGAYAAVHRLEALGYALVEDERPGRFDLGRARELGVPEGPRFGRLQRGEAVEADGAVVEPRRRDGGGAARPHARVHRRHRALRGDGRGRARAPSCSSTTAPSPTRRSSAPRQTGHSTARQAAEVARAAGVSLLALTHLSLALLRAGDREGGARGVRAHGRAARLRRDRGALSASAASRELIRWKEYKERLARRKPRAEAPIVAASRAVATLAPSVPLTRSREARKDHAVSYTAAEPGAERARALEQDGPRPGRPSQSARSHRPRDRGGQPPTSAIALVGIHTRGAFMARRLRALIEELSGGAGPARRGRHHLLSRRRRVAAIGDQPVVHSSRIDFPLEGTTVVLVDDVLYTGRTVRAAIEALFDYGRPVARAARRAGRPRPPRAADPPRLRRARTCRPRAPAGQRAPRGAGRRRRGRDP